MLQQLAHSLSRFIGRFFPTEHKNGEEIRRATIFAWICVGIVFIITLLTLVDVATSNVQYLVEILAFNFFVLVLLFFLKRGVRVSTLSNIFMAVSFSFTVFLIHDSWGILSPLMVYLTIIPALVALIAERKWVILWTLSGAAAAIFFFVLHKQGAMPTEIRNVDYFLTNAVSNYISAILFIAVLFVYSESSRIKARNEVLLAKKQSDDLLLNILPEETANELKEAGSSPARLYASTTVLFTDFKGFTATAESMEPESVVELLNDYFKHFDHICEKYGLEKIKTIGDAYLAVGGLPAPKEGSVKNTVRAALEMQAFVAKRKKLNEAQSRPAFEMRVGIHTGPVVAGIVGIKKFQYDIWGDTVNTASRMESSCEVGKVNVSETTYELVKDQFTCEYRGEVEAKGKGKLKMYFVESLS